jgi:hypothetical protein
MQYFQTTLNICYANIVGLLPVAEEVVEVLPGSPIVLVVSRNLTMLTPGALCTVAGAYPWAVSIVCLAR